jgi:hypothetical protein
VRKSEPQLNQRFAQKAGRTYQSFKRIFFFKKMVEIAKNDGTNLSGYLECTKTSVQRQIFLGVSNLQLGFRLRGFKLGLVYIHRTEGIQSQGDQHGRKLGDCLLRAVFRKLHTEVAQIFWILFSTVGVVY